MTRTVNTNWCVITGAPCSGKSTVITGLREAGFACVDEAARTLIETELATGKTLAQVRADEAAFQRRVIEEKRNIERALKPTNVYFLDRAMPDSIAYFKLKGLDLHPIIELSKAFHYSFIFHLDRLPIGMDGVRIEDEQSADFLDRELEAGYRVLGYDVIRVPMMPIAQRVQFIMKRSGQHC